MGSLLLQFKPNYIAKASLKSGGFFCKLQFKLYYMNNLNQQQINLFNVKSMICMMSMTFVYVC